MKVLYIIDTLEGYGAEKSLVEIATNLKKVTPVFVQVYDGDMLKSELERSGIKVYCLGIKDKYAFNTAVRRLIPIYNKEKPAIVHATLFRSEMIARKMKKIFPNICLVGSFVSNTYSSARYMDKSLIDRLKLFYFHLMNKNTVKNVDYFISNSQTIKEATIKALEIHDSKVKVIYRGRNIDLFKTNVGHLEHNYNSGEEIKLLNVSRLIPLKGQMDLIKALHIVKKEFPKIKLMFAGHGSYKSVLQKEVLKLNLENNVLFLGRVENVNCYLKKAHLFVYPSYSEGLPGALIEAMMAGKIIISSNIQENLECVNNRSAVIFEKGNITELAEKIIEVLKAPEDFKHKGSTAIKQAEMKFDILKIAKEYETTYERFLH